jgi:hypothetical protein
MKTFQRTALAITALGLVTSFGMSAAGATPNCSKAGTILSKIAAKTSFIDTRIATLTTAEQTATALGNTTLATKIQTHLTFLEARQSFLQNRLTEISQACPTASN